MTAHDELHAVIYGYFGPDLTVNSYKSPDQQDHELTDAILAAGYFKVSEAAIERAARTIALSVGWSYAPKTWHIDTARAVVAALREEA